MKYAAAMLSIGVLGMLLAVAQPRSLSQVKALVNSPRQRAVVSSHQQDVIQTVDLEAFKSKREAKKPIVVEDVIVFKKKRAADGLYHGEDYKLHIVVDDITGYKRKRAAEEHGFDVIVEDLDGFRKKRASKNGKIIIHEDVIDSRKKHADKMSLISDHDQPDAMAFKQKRGFNFSGQRKRSVYDMVKGEQSSPVASPGLMPSRYKRGYIWAD